MKSNFYNLYSNKVSKQLVHIMNRYVFRNIYIYIIGLGLILLIVSLIVNERRKVNRINKYSKKDMFLKILTFPVTFFASLISPKSEKKKDKYRKTFSRLGLNITIERFHMLKAVMPIIMSLLILLIYFTNIEYEIQEILNTPVSEGININSDEEIVDIEDMEDIYTSQELYSIYKMIKSNYKDYKILKNSLLANNLTTQDRQVAIYEFTTLIEDNYNLNNADNEVIAKYLLGTIAEIERLKTFDYRYYLLIIVSILIPDIIILFMDLFYKKRYKEDIEILKITTLILGTIDGMTVKKIMQSLMKVSPAYKNIFNNALNSYSSIHDGKEGTIMDMTKEVELPQFRKLCTILKEIASGNKITAINNLEADMILEDKESEMLDNDKIEKKTWIAILIVAPSMLIMMLLILMPFVKYYQSMQF